MDNGHADASDMFGMMFGGGRQRSQGPRRGKDIVHTLKVSLQQLYTGHTMRLAVTRDEVCDSCEGNGTKSGAQEQSCSGCRGRGMRTVVQQLGPGMIQQMTAPCDECHGMGTFIRSQDKCVGCGGKKVKENRAVMEVHIEKGMRAGQKIRFA